ncbi:MAG: tRNA lysidine(34) synthetase TilS [Marinosulfonomonas sp.]|nr:tRNA lysidine(34) synthetase TilS [Marinosulfonomonas sp.]
MDEIELKAPFLDEQVGRVGVAVSGGSDSLALLHLLAEWSKSTDRTLFAVTVDHGLRPEAAEEALAVAQFCAKLGVSHTTLAWTDWDGAGNLQDQARRARYGLMADWARTNDIPVVALGHTLDDQAETFLMRLAREAGVDGLAAMRVSRASQGITWQRPMLQVRRQRLRDYLDAKDVVWVDDPSNADANYNRVKARNVLGALAPLGITAQTLGAVTSHLGDVRLFLEQQTELAARQVAVSERGDVVFDTVRFAALPDDVQRRLLVHAVKWVSSAEYGPRGRALSDFRAAIGERRDVTLHGCRLLVQKAGIRITRELQAVRDTSCAPDRVWDQRWRLSGKPDGDQHIGALGVSGLLLCDEWRNYGLSRASLLASPAVWRNDVLIAAPLAGFANGWVAELANGEDHFFSSILSD